MELPQHYKHVGNSIALMRLARLHLSRKTNCLLLTSICTACACHNWSANGTVLCLLVLHNPAWLFVHNLDSAA